MKTPLVAGVCVGLATGLWMLGEYALGLHDEPAGAGRWTGFLALVFPVVGACWVAIRSTSRTWAQRWKEGVVFGAGGGCVGGAAIYLYHTAVNPGFRVGGRTVNAVEQAMIGLVGALILGTLLTVVMAVIIKRRNPTHG